MHFQTKKDADKRRRIPRACFSKECKKERFFAVFDSDAETPVF